MANNAKVTWRPTSRDPPGDINIKQLFKPGMREINWEGLGYSSDSVASVQHHMPAGSPGPGAGGSQCCPENVKVTVSSYVPASFHVLPATLGGCLS